MTEEELDPRDHRVLGKKLDLFTFSETVGKGLPLWTHRGSTIRRELERFVVDTELRWGYLHVTTPDIAKLDLYKKSGHYPYYKDTMYAPVVIDEEEFMLRPMTCPHHFELYLSKPRSYRELPMRIAEMAKLYRYELSGVLTGLTRVRSFCLADAHIVCADEEQVRSEIGKALDLIEYVAGVFGLEMGKNYSYRLSLGDRADTKKYYDDPKSWDMAEDILRQVLTKREAKFVEAGGEAAFYGPKIDVQMTNVMGREETAFTVQYDFVMPSRFDLEYTDDTGQKRRPLVIHRSSIGALERIIAFLIEHFEGNFPVWLSPVQTVVLPVSEKFGDYGKKILETLMQAGVRTELDDRSESLGNRIRHQSGMKVPYILVVGEKEQADGSVSVRMRGGDTQSMRLDEFVLMVVGKIAQKDLG